MKSYSITFDNWFSGEHNMIMRNVIETLSGVVIVDATENTMVVHANNLASKTIEFFVEKDLLIADEIDNS